MNRTIKFFAFSFILASSAFAQDNGPANGGDSLGLYYGRIGGNVAEAFQKMPSTPTCSVAAQYLDAVNSTGVVSLPLVKKDGIERDAINYPEAKPRPKIEISRKRIIPMSREDLLQSVIHEYLGIAKLEKSDEIQLTRNCMLALSQNGITVESLVPLFVVPRDLIDLFIEGKSEFRCHRTQDASKENYFNLFHEIKAFDHRNFTEYKNFIQFREKRLGGWDTLESFDASLAFDRKLYVPRSFTSDVAHMKETSELGRFFSLDYSIETGNFEYSLELPMKKYLLNFESNDMIHWSLVVHQGKKPAERLECVLDFKAN